MAEGIEQLRQAAARNAGNRYGLKLQPKPTAGDQKIREGEYSDVWVLPVDTSRQLPLMDLNPDSSTFGYVYSLPDYDWPDDPTKIPY